MDMKTLRQTDEDVVILPGARVSGDVTIAHGCSIWYNAVLRGDASAIVLGENTNIQDNVTIHGSHDAPTIVGSGVIVGHNAILHGCTVGDNSLIGMGAIVLDHAVIGKNCIVGAGALVTKHTVVPDGSMVLGSPARVTRPLTPEEIEDIRIYCQSYLEKKELYR
jgi:carbonic anhydrase/acetyltransferase-like protein (isoleucine patch superfamily)